MKRRTEEKKTKQLREKTLEQVRITRAKLQKDHPEMFAALRKLVAQAADKPTQPPLEKFAETKPTPMQQQAAEISDDESVHIDRKKNLEVVLKYAASNPDTKLGDLKDNLKKLLN